MLNFEALYKNHIADVYRFAYWLAGDAVYADDITAAFFLYFRL